MSRWPKGRSGNPGGRPRAGSSIAERARKEIDKGRLLERLGRMSAAEGEFSEIDVVQQMRAMQLLLAHGVGPPRGEVERLEGIKVQVNYVQTNKLAIAAATCGADETDSGS